ncbi:MAG: hypothetical protein IPK80_34990 [Nannocystis sp.]|nr:hypothetical protein [Nannocystis sp.]
MILFELLTRRVPFPGTTALEVLSAHASEQAPSVTERAPDRGSPTIRGPGRQRP